MTIAVATTAVTSGAESLVEDFRIQCRSRAALYAAGELDITEAVDLLQDVAVVTGLVALVGQDVVQAAMAEAFSAVREATAPIPPVTEEPSRKPDLGLPENWDRMPIGALWERLNDPRRHPIPKSIVDAFEHLIKQRDGDRLKTWLLQRTPEERCALKNLLVEK
jgi:hypothetical protein